VTNLLGYLAPAWRDPWNGLNHLLAAKREAGLVWIFVGLMAGWWLYVPIHELCHAWACWLGGGEVGRLEIDGLYGGHFWAAIFPWVVPESDYAGRLSQFSTGGSDLCYFFTCFGPFLLTLFPGVWWLRRAVARGSCFAFGCALPIALAPFMSWSGDFFEMGGIVLTQLPHFAMDSSSLRSDDLFRWIAEVRQHPAPPWSAGLLMGMIGSVLAFSTYAAADMISRRLGRMPVESFTRR
jgi:hypothetical protein